MHKTFSFVALAAALGFGCIVNSDDDGGTTTTTGPSTSTAADDDGNDDVDPSTTNSSVGNDSSTGTPPGDSSSGGGTTMADDTAGDGTATGVAGGCGWGKTGDKMFPEGYICDGDGEGPDPMFPIDCPKDADLTPGADCGDIRAQGCCDANGDLWYCSDAGSGTELATEDCG